MKQNFRLIYVLLLTNASMVLGCGMHSKESFDYINKLNAVSVIDYPDPFDIRSKEESYSGGDYTESFELIYSDYSFSKLLNQIDTLKLPLSNTGRKGYWIHKQMSEGEFKELIIYPQTNSLQYIHGKL